jgi:hypothetical protein
MIFHHVLHLQILQADHLVLANQPGRQLVKKILASILDLLVDPSDFQASFLPTITSVLATRENSLPSSQLLFVLPEILGSLFFFSVGVDEKMLESQVNSNGWMNGIKFLDLVFIKNGDKVFSG